MWSGVGYMAMAVGVSEKWQVICNTQHMTPETWEPDIWPMTCDTWHITYGTLHMTYDTWPIILILLNFIFLLSLVFLYNSDVLLILEGCWSCLKKVWIFILLHSWNLRTHKSAHNHRLKRNNSNTLLVLSPVAGSSKLCTTRRPTKTTTPQLCCFVVLFLFFVLY